MNNAMDQFFASNIDAFLDKPLDEIIIGLDNEELIYCHTPYLLHEAEWALTERQESIIGKVFYARAKALATGAGPGWPTWTDIPTTCI